MIICNRITELNASVAGFRQFRFQFDDCSSVTRRLSLGFTQQIKHFGNVLTVTFPLLGKSISQVIIPIGQTQSGLV